MIYLYGRVISLALLFLIMLEIKNIKEIENSDFVYTALGDSITFGLSATFNYGYTNYFRDFLKSRYYYTKLVNFGKLGSTSSDLLVQLKCSPKIRYSLKKSNIVTIDIGGNNLLKNTVQQYAIIDSQLAQAGVNQFKNDWPQILYYIREIIGCKAQIYVMTLYNPYCYNEFQYQAADYYINEINSCIEDDTLLEDYNYTVIDVYNHFKRNSNKNWICFNNFSRNPHPSDEGHKQIAFLHQQAFEDENNS